MRDLKYCDAAASGEIDPCERISRRDSDIVLSVDPFVATMCL